jgi:hypothetical protein
MIWCGFVCQAIFAITCGFVARAPYPAFFKDYYNYSIPFNNIWKVIFISYLIKLIYSIIFAGPGNLIVNYIKSTSKLDVYDCPSGYNPFKNNKSELLQTEIA